MLPPQNPDAGPPGPSLLPPASGSAFSHGAGYAAFGNQYTSSGSGPQEEPEASRPLGVDALETAAGLLLCAASTSTNQSPLSPRPTMMADVPSGAPSTQQRAADKKAAAAQGSEEGETMVVYDCRHPGCGKTFHSSDAVRKHARKQHVNWLRRIDEEASLTRLMHRTEQYSAKRVVLRSEHEAQQRGADLSDESRSPSPEPPPRSAAAQRPRLGGFAGARPPMQRPPPVSAKSQPNPRSGGASPRSPAEGPSSANGKKPSPFGRSHKKQPQPPKPVVAESESDVDDSTRTSTREEEKEKEDLSGYRAPQSRWNEERAAYDAVLPHGEGWSARQIEWFVGLWWKHLANASVATFHGSLEQFSAWAADTEGLECLIAWIKKIPELGEDLLLLQLLELLEYADLTPSPLLPPLTEVVRALYTYVDKDVAETAERVVPLLEELQTPEAMEKEDRRREKERQRNARLSARAQKAAGKGAAAANKRKAAKEAPEPRGSAKARRLAAEQAAEQEESEGEGEGEEEGEEEEDDDDDDEVCFCGTQRHRYDSPMAFDGVWVQCESCMRWCHGECVGMTAKEAARADAYTCPICAEEEGDDASASASASASDDDDDDDGASVASGSVCSDFASDAEAEEDIDSDGSGLEFRRPDGSVPAKQSREERKREKEREREERRREKEKRRALKAKRAGKGQRPKEGANRCTKTANCSRGPRHPGLCKPIVGGARGSKPPSSGRTISKPKPPLGGGPSNGNRCQKNPNCPRGFRHPGLCRLSAGPNANLSPDSQPTFCQKHPLCLRGHRHPGLCRLASGASSTSPEPQPEFCQKSPLCVRRFRHPGLCKLNAPTPAPPPKPPQQRAPTVQRERERQPDPEGRAPPHGSLFESPQAYSNEVNAISSNGNGGGGGGGGGGCSGYDGNGYGAPQSSSQPGYAPSGAYRYGDVFTDPYAAATMPNGMMATPGMMAMVPTYHQPAYQAPYPGYQSYQQHAAWPPPAAAQQYPHQQQQQYAQQYVQHQHQHQHQQYQQQQQPPPRQRPPPPRPGPPQQRPLSGQPGQRPPPPRPGPPRPGPPMQRPPPPRPGMQQQRQQYVGTPQPQATSPSPVQRISQPQSLRPPRPAPPSQLQQRPPPPAAQPQYPQNPPM